MSRDKQPFISELSRRRKLNLLTRHLQVGSTVLEVGSGSGWFSKRLREYGFNVTTLDLNSHADIEGDINNWRTLGVTPHSFDAVVALEVIEHVDCLDSLNSLCKVGGLIMLSSPHPKWDWVMKILEHLGLTQKRTSAHINLTDFTTIPMPAVILQRPMFVHQVAIFRNQSFQQDAA